MNRKFTLLAAALITMGTFTANAAGNVPEEQWTAGNYYYLKANANDYLSVSGSKADSVIVKPLDVNDASKAAIDSALWQIADKEITVGVTTYQFTNKATQQVLSFAAKADANTNLAAGVDRWVFTGGSVIKGFYDGDKPLELVVTGGKLSLAATGGTAFTVEAPDAAFPLKAQQLGNGFTVFQLVFGDTYGGNNFASKELVAKDLDGADADYVSLQVQGDETFSDGKAKLFGVDTTRTEISGANGAYGANFALDSTYAQLADVHTIGNADFQKFKFTVNLKNDSLAMFVKAAPDVNAATLTAIEGVRVVYAQTADTKVLTVSKETDGVPDQGALPLITAKPGTPVTIPTGSGVYFLKSASKGADGGKYIASYNNGIVVMEGTPSVNLAKGQWYIKENNGKYSIVDREDDTVFGSLNMEIFAVQGMTNTYLFGTDSVAVEFQQVNLNNKYLGSLAFTQEALNDNGYVLNLISGTAGVSDLYAYTTDSILKGKSGDGSDAAVFKLIASDTLDAGGARKLGDDLYVITYKLRGLFDQDTIAKADINGLKFSTYTNALAFKFISDPTGEKYLMTTGASYVAMNVNTSNLELTDASKAAYVNLEAVDAPEYASFTDAHKRLSYNNNNLVMNPLNFFAEMKTEGNTITRADYEADNFSLWVEQDTVISGKQLYFISSGMANAGTAEAGIRFYLAAKDTTRAGIDADTYAMFISHDSIKTMQNSPALFAFKTAEEGGYYLENQKELNENNGKPYVGVVNGFAVMQATPSAAFEVENAPAPTANDEINVSEIKVISSDGQVIVSNASGRKITLSNILGQTIGVRRASSEYFSMPATSGIVLVTVEGDTTYKVIVK